jgi:Phytoene/squalene synthetase
MRREERFYCDEQVERFDNDRYLCAAYAPPPCRQSLIALYAFNLEVARIREQAREPLLAQIRLQWWREMIDKVFAGETPSQPAAAALAEAVRRHGIVPEDLDRYFDGRAQDLEDTAPADLAALEDYAAATVGSLSAMALRVLGAGDDGAHAAMRHVAIAWALIGLVRAVPFHASARRVYLPTELNRCAGLNVFVLFDKGDTSGLSQVCEEIATSAASHLRAARAMRRDVPRIALPAILIATIGDHYLARLRRSGYNPFRSQVQGRGRRVMLRIAANAALGRF